MGPLGHSLENKVEDVVAVFGYLKPDLFRRSSPPYQPMAVRRAIAPYFLRRRVQDADIELPEKIIRTVELELTPAQRASYNQARSRSRATLSQPGATRVHVLAEINKLKQICNRDEATGSSCKLEYLMEQLEKITGYVEIGRQEGAECLIGGERNVLEGDLAGGYYFKPTILKGHKFPGRFLINRHRAERSPVSPGAEDSSVLKVTAVAWRYDDHRIILASHDRLVPVGSHLPGVHISGMGGHYSHNIAANGTHVRVLDILFNLTPEHPRIIRIEGTAYRRFSYITHVTFPFER